MRINLSIHAKGALIEGGTSGAEIRETIIRGTKIRQDADKVRSECGPWAVVYRKARKIKDKIVIITATYR